MYTFYNFTDIKSSYWRIFFKYVGSRQWWGRWYGEVKQPAPLRLWAPSSPVPLVPPFLLFFSPNFSLLTLAFLWGLVGALLNAPCCSIHKSWQCGARVSEGEGEGQAGSRDCVVQEMVEGSSCGYGHDPRWGWSLNHNSCLSSSPFALDSKMMLNGVGGGHHLTIK